MTASRPPVPLGVAQYCDRDGAPGNALSPPDMLARVGAAAIADCDGRAISLDALAVVRLFADSSPSFSSPFGSHTNLPRSMARRMGRSPRPLVYGPVGGNTPQMLANHTLPARR